MSLGGLGAKEVKFRFRAFFPTLNLCYESMVMPAMRSLMKHLTQFRRDLLSLRTRLSCLLHRKPQDPSSSH